MSSLPSLAQIKFAMSRWRDPDRTEAGPSRMPPTRATKRSASSQYTPAPYGFKSVEVIDQEGVSVKVARLQFKRQKKFRYHVSFLLNYGAQRSCSSQLLFMYILLIT